MVELRAGILAEREQAGVTWGQGRWCVDVRRVLSNALEQCGSNTTSEPPVLAQLREYLREKREGAGEGGDPWPRLPAAGYPTADAGEEPLPDPKTVVERFCRFASQRARNIIRAWSKRSHTQWLQDTLTTRPASLQGAGAHSIPSAHATESYSSDDSQDDDELDEEDVPEIRADEPVEDLPISIAGSDQGRASDENSNLSVSRDGSVEVRRETSDASSQSGVGSPTPSLCDSSVDGSALRMSEVEDEVRSEDLMEDGVDGQATAASARDVLGEPADASIPAPATAAAAQPSEDAPAPPEVGAPSALISYPGVYQAVRNNIHALQAEAMTSAQFMQALALDIGVSLDTLRRARAHIERAVEVCGEVAHHGSLVIRATNGQDILFDNFHLRETIRALVREHEHSEDLTLRRFRELLAAQLGVEVEVLEPMSQAISALILLERQRWVDFWWREYLFDPLIPPNEFKCLGTTWQSDLTKPVFKQCFCKRHGTTDFCQKHLKDLGHGRWDPADELRSCPAPKMREAVAEAQRRARMAGGLPPPPRPVGSRGRRVHGAPAAGRRQKAYVVAEGDLRSWSAEPGPLPPYPCQLCDQNFATRAFFHRHLEECHHGFDEYRKRLFYLMTRLEGLEAGRPQLWRHTVEAFTEELVTGERDWPECAIEGEGEPRQHWWRLGSEKGDERIDTSAEAFACQPCLPDEAVVHGSVSPAPLPSTIDLDALGRRGTSRRRVRCLVPCCVCARNDWASKRLWMHFWASPTHVQEGRVLLSDESYKGKAQPDAGLRDKAGLSQGDESFSARDWASWLLSPDRYRERWRFAQHSASAVKERGIPLEELQASAVREPGPRKRLWLLHKKCFKFVRDEHGDDVADPTQRVPVCPECVASLTGRAPRLPKFSLANDLWMGQLPPQLRGLSEGAWLLLALARPFIRRFGCLTDSGKWTHPEERIKAFIGNVCAFTQADGGSLVAKLPPRAEDLVGRITIAFAGSDGDLKRARLRALAVSPAAFKRAYDYLHRCNPIYAAVSWDEAAAMDLSRDRSVLGLPACLGACVRVDEMADPKAQSVRQEGPGEAVQSQSDDIPPEEKESGEGLDSNDCGRARGWGVCRWRSGSRRGVGYGSRCAEY